jgi:mevalonate kinase
MLKRVKVSAPGKVILSGEHAVVYGHPALLTAVSRRLSIARERGKKRLIDSNIPIGCGMGSSAAYAVALSALKLKLDGKKWDLQRINNEAYKMEKKQHGNPSGGDNTVVTYGGFLWYRKEIESFKIFSTVKITRKLPEFFIIDTGRPKETTKEMIQFIGEKRTKNPRAVNNIFREIEEITRAFLKFLTIGGGDLSELIRENQTLLEKLGVVSNFTSSIAKEISKIGGAAKISGAGGRKLSSGILLVHHLDTSKLLHFAKRRNLKIFSVKLGEEGVRIDRKN